MVFTVPLWKSRVLIQWAYSNSLPSWCDSGSHWERNLLEYSCVSEKTHMHTYSTKQRENGNIYWKLLQICTAKKILLAYFVFFFCQLIFFFVCLSLKSVKKKKNGDKKTPYSIILFKIMFWHMGRFSELSPIFFYFLNINVLKKTPNTFWPV